MGAVLISGAAGCAADTPADRRAPFVAGSGAPVVVPGAPGGAARTATPGERIGESDARTGAADVRFAEAMIPHHRQALEMAGLVAGRDAGAEVAALAGRIAQGQGPEIATMTSWLASLGRPAPAAHAHARRDAYGMATPEEMNRLRGARGTAFDTLFLRLMIRHHEGAVRMAEEELRDGADRLMREMARDVVSGQRAEIGRMRRMLAA
ncbi:DUF305 domain-containing protein [Microtetraspora niveoalba]|uniref:DUF305 domain-containing protein n=1 Tax=Microtetraspora niveoalba TaxID=46175 RepID=UPI001FDF580F|nr:DUF305 domain-containing protein [Microtetraspora niveoalba]